MSDGIKVLIGDDGVARMHDDTYDITIHCESKQEQDEVVNKLQSLWWIPCEERLPDNSDEVLCCDKYGEYLIGRPYEDDDSYTGYCAEGDDGYLMVYCVAWMPLPKPWEELKSED